MLRALLKVIAFMVFIAFFALAVSATSCTPERENCSTPDKMRCDDNVAQLCTNDGKWFEEDDCNNVEIVDGGTAEWNCCMADGEAFCMGECDA